MRRDATRKCGDTLIPISTVVTICLPENHQHYAVFNGKEGMTTEPFTAHDIEAGYVSVFIKSDKNANISIDANIHEKYLIIHREFAARNNDGTWEDIKMYNANVATSQYYPDKPYCIRRGTAHILCKTLYEARIKIKTFWSDRTI